jgi:hypothetical protein
MGVIEGNQSVTDNEWETITKGGDKAIQRWIDGQLYGKSCVVVLIGSNTAGRPWINYEIIKGWNDKKGIVGICIHNLKSRHGEQSSRGNNPFDYINYGTDGTKLSSIVKVYDPFNWSSKHVYDSIKENIDGWVEEAINIRSRH